MIIVNIVPLRCIIILYYCTVLLAVERMREATSTRYSVDRVVFDVKIIEFAVERGVGVERWTGKHEHILNIIVFSIM